MTVEAQNVKYVSITPPAAIIDDATATTAEVDTQGYDYATVVCYLGATDIAMTALAVTESDTSGSGHANVTGLIYGTSSDIVGTTSSLPSASEDNKFFVFQIDLRGRKRYIDLTATIGDGSAGTFFVAFAILSRTESTPTTVAGAGDVGTTGILRV